MERHLIQICRFIALVIAGFTFTGLLVAQTRKPGSGPGYGTVTVGTDVHHDLSPALHDIEPSTTPRHPIRVHLGDPLRPHLDTSLKDPSMTARPEVAGNTDLRSADVVPELVNGGTGVATT